MLCVCVQHDDATPVGVSSERRGPCLRDACHQRDQANVQQTGQIPLAAGTTEMQSKYVILNTIILQIVVRDCH